MRYSMMLTDRTNPDQLDETLGDYWPSAEPAVAVPVEVDATPSQRGADVARVVEEMGRP